MRWMLFAMAAAIAALFCLPVDAAQPAPATAGPAAISFDQYRDWRNAFIDRRRSELSVQLADAALPAARKTRLTQVKEYYDWLAGLPAAERDHRFRERFDQIDANHDGIIDAGERTAWRDKQRAFYHRSAPADAAAHPTAAAASATEASPVTAELPFE